MNLSEIILNRLTLYHRGRFAAITRRELLIYLRQSHPDLSDRQMRRAYEDLPICSGPMGLFVPETKQEIDDYERYLSQKMPPWKVQEKMERLRVKPMQLGLF